MWNRPTSVLAASRPPCMQPGASLIGASESSRRRRDVPCAANRRTAPDNVSRKDERSRASSDRGLPPAASWSELAAAEAADGSRPARRAFSASPGHALVRVTWSGRGDPLESGEIGSSKRVMPNNRSRNVDGRAVKVGEEGVASSRPVDSAMSVALPTR